MQVKLMPDNRDRRIRIILDRGEKIFIEAPHESSIVISDESMKVEGLSSLQLDCKVKK